MSWLLALLYLLAGTALGLGLAIVGLTKTLAQNDTRRVLFRKLAEFWPIDLETALGHASITRPRDTIPEPIEFQTCAHCTLPWPLQDDGTFVVHPAFDERLSRSTCPGSNHRDFLEFE